MDVDYFQDTTMLIAGSLADSVDGGRPSVGARFAGPLDRINHKKNSIEVSPVRLGVFLNIGYYRMIDLRYAVGLQVQKSSGLVNEGDWESDLAFKLSAQWYTSGLGPEGFFVMASLFRFDGELVEADEGGKTRSVTSIIGNIGYRADVSPDYDFLYADIRFGLEYVVGISNFVPQDPDTFIYQEPLLDVFHPHGIADKGQIALNGGIYVGIEF